MPSPSFSPLQGFRSRLSAELIPYKLHFRKPATTSRDTMQEHQVWYLKLTDTLSGKYGWGEIAPLKGLSKDDPAQYPELLSQCLELIREGAQVKELPLDQYPALRFGIETALLDLARGGRQLLFENDFSTAGAAIPINGLVWMNDFAAMYKEALEKIEAGFRCIKFKIGALDFDEECRLLEKIRKQFDAFKIELRVDANGAFTADDALEKLKELARFELHSIEQPVKPLQPELMEELCAKSRIPIALDEELIHLSPNSAKAWLSRVKPHFLVIKPTLVGGLERAAFWVNSAKEQGIGWWVTSALESNLGLNAIAQFTACYELTMAQGLGTGALYLNNPGRGLKAEAGLLSGILDGTAFENEMMKGKDEG